MAKQEDIDKKEYEAWFNSRPTQIQNLIKKYPIGIYKIKEGAPYRLTFPGSIVSTEASGKTVK